MRPRRRALILVAVALLLLGGAAPAATARAAPARAEACFAQTGFCVQGRFLDHWLANGGLARNGFPLTGERRERLEDGRERTVQYFERVRLEYHPENAPPDDVLLGQLGRRVRAADPPVPPVTDPYFRARYFPETGHNVFDSYNGGQGGRPVVFPLGFRSYCEENGGLRQFGYPISEWRQEQTEDGRVRTVQYFERARFEYHGYAGGGKELILLGQLGRLVLAEVDAGR